MWEWVEFDAVIMLDSDMVVRGDLTHVFHLPTDFAWTMDSGPGMEIEAGEASHSLRGLHTSQSHAELFFHQSC